jgi:hypothetical protein
MGPPGPVWTGVRYLASHRGAEPRTVQPVASHYTDYPIPAHINVLVLAKYSHRLQLVHSDCFLALYL